MVVLVAILHHLIDRLGREEDNVRFVLEAAPAGIVAVDDKGVITAANAAIERQFGYSRDELIGKSIEILVPERARSVHAGHQRAFMAATVARRMGGGRDLCGRRKDGSEFPVEVGLNPIERDGRKGALATVLDISERKAAERRQEILVHELEHRTRNLLAIFQAIAMRTLTAGKSVEQCRKDLVARIAALSRAQNVFADSESASLAGIVELELASFKDQTAIGGPPVVLTPISAQNFTLIVHELTTNAVKHGALSVPAGMVSVHWTIDGHNLTFTWAESGGPPVPATAARRGFGQVILNDLAKEFSLSITADLAATGFRYELQAELPRVAEPRSDTRSVAA
jgi:PAS domain S-box-containing protein